MENTTVHNRSHKIHSFNPSFWKTIPVGNFKMNGEAPFYVKNESDDAIMCVAVGADMEDADAVSTKIYPGWNPELFRSIVVPVGVTTLKYGY